MTGGGDDSDLPRGVYEVPSPTVVEQRGRRISIAVCPHLGFLEASPTEHGDDPSGMVEVSRLCEIPEAVEELLADQDADGVVLGVCSSELPQVELEAAARRAGLDSFSLELVRLPPSQWTRRNGRAVLEAAAAALRAQAPVRPENRRAVLDRGPMTRRGLFRLSALRYEPVPTIRRAVCRAPRGCDRCVRVCPFDALRTEADRIAVDSAACKSCGLCAAECPSRAVALPTASPEEFEARVGVLASHGLAVAYACKRLSDTRLPEGWALVPVPCTGAVTHAALIWPLVAGSPAVAVLGCESSCLTGAGPRVRGRVEFVRSLLAEASEGDARRIQSGLPAAPPPPARSGELPGDGGSRTMFGAGAAAQALMALSAKFSLDELQGEYDDAPFGLVTVEPDKCTVCGTCSVCPTGAMEMSVEDGVSNLRWHPSMCDGCGVCVEVCPEEGAISVARGVDTVSLRHGTVTMAESAQVLCSRCGRPVATRATLDRIAAILGEDYDPELMGMLCADCRGMGSLR